MSIPISTSSSASSIQHRLPNEDTKKFRDVSFSSYLDVSEETFVLQLGCPKTTPNKNLNSSISTPHDLKKSKHEDTEIEVFDARKYFKDGLNLNPTSTFTCKTLPRQHLVKKQEAFEIKDKALFGSPSIRSISSSNSRSALLHKAPRNQLQPKQGNKKNFLYNIRCNCYCNDKNAVDVDDSIDKDDHGTVHHHHDLVIKKPETVYNFMKSEEPELRDCHFSFPVFNPKPGNPIKIQLQDPGHKSVFGSPVQENGSGLEKNLKLDAIAPAVTEEIRNPPRSYEDGDSDASSDLFEIESLSKGDSFLSRQGSDGLSGRRNCYAPSEASVEWSVVTASAADFSVLSDSEELRPNSTNTQKKKEISKRRPSIISGCKSQKAIRVAGDAHRPPEFVKGNGRVIKSESFTRFRDEVGIDAVKRQHSFDARILSVSKSGGSCKTVHLLYV